MLIQNQIHKLDKNTRGQNRLSIFTGLLAMSLSSSPTSSCLGAEEAPLSCDACLLCWAAPPLSPDGFRLPDPCLSCELPPLLRFPAHGFEPLTSCMPSSVYSTAPTVAYFDDISWEFKPDWVNIGKQMRWIFVRNAVNFCMKCGEMRCNIYFHRIHRNHRISYKNSPRSPHFLQKFTQNPRPGHWFLFCRPNYLKSKDASSIIKY